MIKVNRSGILNALAYYAQRNKKCTSTAQAVLMWKLGGCESRLQMHARLQCGKHLVVMQCCKHSGNLRCWCIGILHSGILNALAYYAQRNKKCTRIAQWYSTYGMHWPIADWYSTDCYARSLHVVFDSGLHVRAYNTGNPVYAATVP
jgi:hypothetical protein